MNTFATIREVKIHCKKVRFYTVTFIDKPRSEFFDFVTNHENRKEIAPEYGDIMEWIQLRIGDRKGAIRDFFRKEDKANALPPYPEIIAMEADMEYSVDLRLYCYRISDHIVFLFNGGIKTTRFAEDCGVVGDHYRNANKLTLAIKSAIDDGHIKLNKEETELFFEPDYKLEI